MRRFITLAAALSVAVASSAQFKTPRYSDLGDSETVASFKEHVSYIASPSMEGRAPGSAGEEETLLYVEEVFKNYGIDVISDHVADSFGIKQENGDTLTSRNVLGFIPGYDKDLKGEFIVIGAHADNLGTMKLIKDGVEDRLVFNGANANASGVAMLLELGRMLSTNSLLLKRSVILAVFGSSNQTFAGAWYFLNRSFKDAANISAMIDLDVLGIGSEGFYAYTFSNKDMNAVVESLALTLQPVQPKVTSAQPFPSDQMAFYDKEIPSVLFTTGRFPEFRTHKDVESIIEYEPMERILEYVYNFAVTLVNGPKPIFNVETELRKRAEEGGPGAIPFYDCDYKPSFLGHNDPRFFLEKWVYQYLRYPKQALSDGIQGKVLVDFIIDESGNVTDVKVLKGVDPLLDEEAVRVVSASPKWKPGIVKGKKVKTEISLYIEFRLEKKKR